MCRVPSDYLADFFFSCCHFRMEVLYIMPTIYNT